MSDESTEYIIEIEKTPEPFKTIEQAIKWAKENIKRGNGRTVNIVSRDITVIDTEV